MTEVRKVSDTLAFVSKLTELVAAEVFVLAAMRASILMKSTIF
jgi:hypothetical protein